ncbi:F-box domain [Arabidopsis thaliana x Arabidopsis arenosa]|uniref:F-box domain n=1 Tax=Arabidopsis thaliana x Arabidopsis arenosa TaxID=1240361 RepID=A0A8T2EUY5_9BRAS|nr:F-box domain [Arabidopsis thaliana x Arabidopsis arenosa]
MDCLPDDLLVQILYLLPTKEAVSTSVLSKRWRTLFTRSDNLDFHNPISGRPEDILKSFNDFVDSSLAFQGGKHIKKFSLHTKTNTFEYDVLDHWICNALEHGVSELHLHLMHESWPWLFSIPSKVFNSSSLVKLSLGSRLYCPSFPPDTSLPALKVLLLDSILFRDDQLSNVFLAACPALEDLTIHHTYHPCVISSKSIKKLSLSVNSGYYGAGYILTLDTPSVVDLYYSDSPRHNAPLFHLDSLAKVTLDLHFIEDNNREVQNDADVKNLIREICNVKTLHLTCSAVESVKKLNKGGLPMFNNLVELVFSSKKEGWRVLLPLLLENSPNLETLVLSDLHRYTFGRRHRFVGIPIPPNNQIKVLRIMQYQGSATVLKHISHFLLNMDCLEVMKVNVAAALDDPKKMQLTEDLLKLPTASCKLKIQVL